MRFNCYSNSKNILLPFHKVRKDEFMILYNPIPDFLINRIYSSAFFIYPKQYP
jgi:hypothetical protein